MILVKRIALLPLIVFAIVITPFLATPWKKEVKLLWHVIGNNWHKYEKMPPERALAAKKWGIKKYFLFLIVLPLFWSSTYIGVNKVVEVREVDTYQKNFYQLAGNIQSWLSDKNDLSLLSNKTFGLKWDIPENMEVGAYDKEHFYIQFNEYPVQLCDELISLISKDSIWMAQKNEQGLWSRITKKCTGTKDVSIKIAIR